MSVRVRFAPSPTGYLHIGGARTALFNWLFAHREGGTSILRIEDTDVERSSAEMVQGIIDGLEWLGLKWDEGPFHQSARLDLYRSAGERLLESGKAYRCFCTPEMLEQRKQEAVKAGRTWRYDRACLELSPHEIEKRLKSSQPYALRYRVPDKQQVSFRDLVYGTVEVETENIEDFVILRSDGMPTYHLSVVVDDAEMEISHVIRGADHLANTSKHVLLFQAFEQSLPTFVHLPLILGPDKKRLSKRHGATSVLEYKNQGFLPAAVRNYLALLGWSPGTDQEILSEEELTRLFDLQRINKANAVFDVQKLEWMNGQYISQLSSNDLEPEVRRVLQERSLWNTAWENGQRDRFRQTIELLKSRTRRLTDFADFGRAFFTDDFEYDETAVEKYLSLKNGEQQRALIESLQELQKAYESLHEFTLESTERVLREIVDRRGVKAGQLIGAVRVLLTGKSVAPGIFEVIVALGKEKTLERLRRGLQFLQ